MGAQRRPLRSAVRVVRIAEANPTLRSRPLRRAEPRHTARSVTMPTSRRAVTLGSGAPELRRQLGSTAWSALEVLAASTDVVGDAHASVRTVAAELDVAVNTAQR